MRSGITPLIILAAAAAGMCEMRFTASTSTTNVAVGEQVTVVAEFVSDGELRGVAVPSVPQNEAFDLIGTSQSQSRSTQIEIINGRTTQRNEITYQFRYTIVPKKAGGFEFPALTAGVDKKNYSTDPISFTASAGSGATSAPGTGGTAPAAPAAGANADVTLSLSIGKQSLYVGDQTVLTFKLGQRANSPTQADRGFDGAVKALEKSFDKNFSLIRLFSNQVTAGQERRGNDMYRTFSLQWVVIPVSAGSLTIPSVPYEYAELHRARSRGMDPFFDDFFGNNVRAEPRVTRSNPLSIRVKELPPPPADFSGVVGRCRLTAAIDPQTVPAGEAATLKIMINADTRPGNVTDIKLPKIDGCEVFTPEKQARADTTAQGITTTKTFKYLLIPQQEGPLTIPPIEISYFDPSADAYKKASSGPLSIEVTRGKGGAKPQTRYLTQEEIREVGTDIRYIKTGVKLSNVNDKPYRNPLFLLLYPLPFAMFLLALIYRAQSQHREANAELYMKNRAFKSAYKTLSEARKAGLNASEFLSIVAETLERYISQKFAFAATGRTLDELKTELRNRNTSEKIVADLAVFVEQLDSYRFGGAAFDDASRAAIIDRAATFLGSLEKGEKSAKKSFKTASRTAARLIVLFALAALSRETSAAPVSLWFETANKFYTEQAYDSAAVYYEKIIGSGFSSSAVYYNLGNAYFRAKKLGLSRLCYEKASLLDPADPEITANIKFVTSTIVDRTEAPQRGFIESVLFRLHVLMPLKVQLWFCFGLLLAIAMLASAALYASHNQRLWLMYVSTLLALLFAASGLSMGIKVYDAEKTSFAILLEPAIDARNEPDGGKILFTAHEGTKFQVRKTVGSWSLVSLPNGVSGWVENKALGKI